MRHFCSFKVIAGSEGNFSSSQREQIGSLYSRHCIARAVSCLLGLKHYLAQKLVWQGDECSHHTTQWYV
jgi:hypothetical protein